MTAYGESRLDVTLQPVSGKAIPVYQGEVLRISQVGAEQCVDFNCFNLHDYKERMSAADMREQGFRPKQGHVVVSAPPRYRPMMAVLKMAETCVTDLLGARCDATSGEREYGLVPRTNCQDTFAESIREYGLTPDDVHDSFNLWMHTVWDDSYYPVRNVGPTGDHVDLLALMDVLAVPIICGSGDIAQISNFGLKPIRVEVFEASAGTRAAMQPFLERCSGLKNQRGRESFRNQAILGERKLKPIAGYQPKYRTIEQAEIEVRFGAAELKALKGLRGKLGKTDEEVVRAAFMLWYMEHRMKPHWIQPEGPGCLHCEPRNQP
jgi:hypothetical protein